MRELAADGRRISTLDGIRGWGALFVVMYHVFVQNFPLTSVSAEWLGRLLPFRGNSAVFAFFIISGYALSVGYLRRRDLGILARIAIGRYFRLVVPIVLGCSVVYAAVAFGLIITPARRVAAEDLSVVTNFAFFGAFSFAPPVSGRPIPQLWTMPYELLGSFLVLLLVFVLSSHSWRFYVYASAAIVMLFVEPIYSAFIFGVIFAELSLSDTWSSFRYSGCVFFLAALVLLFVPEFEYRALVVVLSAAIVWSLISSANGRAILSGKISEFLGGISFPLYILHGVVIHSFGVWLHKWMGVSTFSVIMANCITVAACLIFGWAFRWIDTLGIKCSHIAASILLPGRFQRATT